MNILIMPHNSFRPWTTPYATRANQPNNTVPPEPQSDAISAGGSDLDKRVHSLVNLLQSVFAPKSFDVDEVTLAKIEDLLSNIEESEFEEIEQQTVDRAKQFLCEFREITNSTEWAWRVPRIATDGNGDIAIEWWHGGRALIFSVNPEGKIDYLEAWGPNINEQMEEGVNPDPDLLIELWEKLHIAN